MSPTITVRHVTPDDLPAIRDLQPRAFGPGRFARTAYRIREGQPLISQFCLVAMFGSQLIAAIRFTEVEIGGVSGALLLVRWRWSRPMRGLVTASGSPPKDWQMRKPLA